MEGLVVGRDVAQRPVCRGADGGLRVGLALAGRQRTGIGVARLTPVLVDGQRPDPVQEAMDATDPGRAPRSALVPRAHEHQEQPDRVGAVAGDQVVGRDDVAARLAHPLAVGAQDLALVEQALERLTMVDQPDIGHRLGPEAAVQQVHDGVLGAARVLVDRRPAIGHRAVDRAVHLLRGEVAEPVPRRVDERVERVGLAPRRPAAARARRLQERLVVIERVVAAPRVIDGLG